MTNYITQINIAVEMCTQSFDSYKNTILDTENSTV